MEPNNSEHTGSSNTGPSDTGPSDTTAYRESMMRRAMANAETARLRCRPNPWVGAVLVDNYGVVYDGATHQPGGQHAEREALSAAGDAAKGATVFTTLEPCNHSGRTGSCAAALIDAEVARVVIGVTDPDELVSGDGIARLEASGIEVIHGVLEAEVTEQLRPYLTQRRTGRPYVIAKLAQTLDGAIAAPDGSSKWITGPEARRDVHRLRAESDAIIVGTGTVEADDPSLTVRDYTPPQTDSELPRLDPWRIVVGKRSVEMQETAKTAPFEPWKRSLDALLDELGQRSAVQVLVEGGATLAGSFHREGLIDEYWIYLAPALMGGSNATSTFAGDAAETMADVQRGTFVSATPLGNDLRIIYRPDQ